jgi:small-conductance mechanosensitive channel
MKRRRYFAHPQFRSFLAFLFASMLAVIASAAAPTTQTTQPAPTSAPSVQPPSGPFPLAQAATEAESASITLRSMTAELNGDQQTAQIAEEIPILTSEIDGRLDETSKLLSSGASLQLLGMQEDDWSAISKSLDQWKRLLQQRHNRLQSVGAQLSRLRSDWDREHDVVTYWSTHAKSTDLLNAARNSVDDTRAIIDRTQGDLHARQVELFAVEQAVDGQDARVLDVLDLVRQARDQAFNRLLVRDSPPLWDLEKLSKNNGGAVEEGHQSFGDQFEAVVAYLKRRWANVGAEVALLAALLIALYWIRARTRRWVRKEPDLEQATRVFASPIATAVVLSLAASGRIYPQAPRLLWAMIGAAALIPTVIILRRLIDRRWFLMLNALVVCYFIDQMRSVVAVVPTIARALLLIEMLGGILVLISFRRSTATAGAGRGNRLIRLLSWLWLAVLVLAALGDILGYVSLANLLGDVALQSAYIAVVIYACTRIVSGLLLITMRVRPLCELTMVRQHQQLLYQRLNLGLAWIASAIWVIGVLTSLSIASAAFDLMKRILSSEFGYGEIHFSLGHILAFAFTIWFSVQLSRFLRFVLEEDIYARFALPGGIPYAISKMLNYFILLIGFFIAVSALGYDMTKFTILAGAFGVGLGFGMQNIVNNFVSGLILLFERPVKVGDVIQMDDTTGVVGHIGIRASVIRTSDAAEIIVPNGNLISNKVTNWTLSNRQRGIQIKVAVAASADPTRVIQLLTGVAKGNPLITDNPRPEAFLTTFSGDSFNYELHVWTNNADQWIQIRSDLAVAIHKTLTGENIPLR